MSLHLAGVTHANKSAARPGRLRRRIANVGTNQQQAMGNYHPWGTVDTPQLIPLTLITMSADGAQVQRMTPLVTANGAMIPATAPGRWDQVAAAGRP